jgi:uncharacterized protein (DUF934 family)
MSPHVRLHGEDESESGISAGNPPIARILMADGVWRDDRWTVVPSTTSDDGIAAPAAGQIVPLARYLALDAAARTGIAVWLAPADEPAALLPFLAALPLIAVDFPTFKDGRGCSTATLLRSRHRYTGELRAIGDVLVDQLFALRRVGFTSFALRADQVPAAAEGGLRTFTETYQRAVDKPVPLFRRRLTAGAGAGI